MNELVEEMDKCKREEDDQTTSGGITDINKCKIKNWKERSKMELTGRSPLKRQRSALNCRIRIRIRTHD
jgi:hypothetical protein